MRFATTLAMTAAATVQAGFVSEQLQSFGVPHVASYADP